jgi:hypothetical protein
MRLAGLLVLATALNRCVPPSELLRFDGPSPPPVEVGRYPSHVDFLCGPHRLDPTVARLRGDIEAHESILRRITREHSDAKSPLEFRFMYAAVDSAGGTLLLRYFAPHPSPVAIAGWQAQLVYELPCRRLLRVYVSEVPLE